CWPLVGTLDGRVVRDDHPRDRARVEVAVVAIVGLSGAAFLAEKELRLDATEEEVSVELFVGDDEIRSRIDGRASRIFEEQPTQAKSSEEGPDHRACGGQDRVVPKRHAARR